MEQRLSGRRAVTWGALVIAATMTTTACSGRVEAVSVGAGSSASDDRPAIPAREDGTVGAVATMLNALVMEPEVVDPTGIDWTESVLPQVPEILAREVMASGAAGWPVLQRSAFASDVADLGSLDLTAVALAAAARGDAVGVGPGCPDVEQWVVMKHRWQLSVDRIELESLVGWFDGCIDGPAPQTQIG